MNRRVRQTWAFLLGSIVLAAGCRPVQPGYLFEDGDMSHYVGMATEIEYPDDRTPSLAEVDRAVAPFTISNSDAQEIWDLTLEEAVKNALANSKVVRQLGGQVQSSPISLLNSPDVALSVYNPAIVETNPVNGVEAALSAFDTQFSSGMFWERNDRPVNVGGFADLIFAPVNLQDLGTFQAQLQKTAATGGTFTMRHNVLYDWNNNPSRAVPSDWNTNIEAEFRQPLLQGAGVEFNRIAGPSAQPGFFFGNGVLLARTNVDIALADFEAGVRNMVRDVETAYWELYFAYRNLDAVLAGRDSALQTWRRVYALYDVGARGGEAENEAQAREQYFLFRAQVENSLSNVYSTESRLRYIMGIASTDGRLIRPIDEPTTAPVQFDWQEIHQEMLVRSVELRRQRFRVKQRELELVASRNFLLPRLDAVGRYRWLGLGDQLLGPDDGFRVDAAGGAAALTDTSAYATMFDGNFEEWQLGLQLQIPIGFRQQLAAVRNAQLQLAQSQAVLQDQELEASHHLSDTVRDLDRSYHLTQTNFNRRRAAADEVNAVQVAFDTGVVTLDLLLDAQRRLADSESSYFRSLVDYNLSITAVHYRKNSLLEYNGVFLTEGPWPDKAYFDARRKARMRDAAIYMDYGYTRPAVFSRGPVNQMQGTSVGDGMMMGQPEEVMRPESPAPLPAPGSNQPLPPLPPQGAYGQGSLGAISQQPGQVQMASATLGSQALRPGQAAIVDPRVQPARVEQTTRGYESVPNPSPAANYQPPAGWGRPQY